MPRTPQFIEHLVPPDLEASWYCPTCQSGLTRRALHDPYCVGVVCERGHRFQFPRLVVEGHWIELASQLPPIGSTEIKALLSAWMNRPEYRGYLQSQAAAALCRVHDFEVIGDRVEWEPAPQVTFRYCPRCRDELRFAPDQDSHSIMLVCSHKHDYQLHGNLYFKSDGRPVEMDSEIADVPLIPLCRRFSAKGDWANAIHREIATAFGEFARRHHELWQSAMKARGFPVRT